MDTNERRGCSLGEQPFMRQVTNASPRLSCRLAPSRSHVGQKLLAKYKEKNPKALPNLFCHEPVITKLAIHFE